MKKVRITTTRGSKGKAFKIFNSPESLYVWLNDPDLQAEVELDPSLGNTVHLQRGEVMEVEWYGFEHIYEDNKLQFRADYVKIGKLINTPMSFLYDKDVVGIQDGWITQDIIAHRNSVDDSARITKLTSKSKHKFNLEELFAARESYEDSYEDEEEMKENVILN